MRILAILLVSCALVARVTCLEFSFPKFNLKNSSALISSNSNIAKDAIQVTYDLSDPREVMNTSGRSFYKDPFTIWRKGQTGEKITASFNASFMLNISPYPQNQYPIGEGLAFVLTGNTSLPSDSQGQWLGIVNSDRTLPIKEGIVAVEFDTRKSFPRDIDDNHVGLNLNSIYSVNQTSLTSYGINISAGVDLAVQVLFDGKKISVFVSLSNGTKAGLKSPVLTFGLDVSRYLPEQVYVGFAAATGNDSFQRNCVRSWEFYSTVIDEFPSKDKDFLWVWILVPLVLLVLFVLALWLYWTRPQCAGDVEESRVEKEIQGSSTAPKKFKLSELKRATNGFSPKNQLGKGGFGTVYKGTIGGDMTVAVKRVSKSSNQRKQEFVSEVKTIASLSHRNLVKLLGWCYERGELLMVYEFMPNGSLDKFLFPAAAEGEEEEEDLKEKEPQAPPLGLSWERRLGIARGVGTALEYLHHGSERRVLHRDVKASNVMLDSDFNAKLGDFGLARTVETSDRTHHSTMEIAGTYGYMAPESFFTGRATVQTDVYAFGVLLLELVSGRKPGGGGQGKGNDAGGSFTNVLVSWVWRLYEDNRALEAVDPRLEGEFGDDKMLCVIELALGCCHPNQAERPSMKTILKVLSGEESPPCLPQQAPAFVWPSSMPPSFKDDGDSTQHGGYLTTFTQVTGR